MGDPTSPVKPGIFSEPLSPEEMWRQAVQSQRGFLSSRGGDQDIYRQQPATIPSGAAAGDKGSE